MENVQRLAMAKREVRAKSLEELVSLEPRPITFEARETFAQAFGIEPEEQLLIEMKVQTLDILELCPPVTPDLRI
jgi:hypothetical protein